MKNIIKNYSGLSLMEMLVAIAIFTIAIAGFSMLYIRSIKSNTYILKMGQTSFALSQGLNKMVEYIRTARQGDNGNAAIVAVADNSLTIYSDFDNDQITERLHFYLDNQQIKLGITNPTAGANRTYPNGDEETKIIAEHIVNGTGDKLFQYYPVGLAQAPIEPSTGDISAIRMVKIFLKMNIDPSRGADDIEMQSYVEFRNLYNNDI